MFYQFDDANMYNDISTQLDDAILDFDEIPQSGEDDVITTCEEAPVCDGMVRIKDEADAALWSKIRNVR